MSSKRVTQDRSRSGGGSVRSTLDFTDEKHRTLLHLVRERSNPNTVRRSNRKPSNDTRSILRAVTSKITRASTSVLSQSFSSDRCYPAWGAFGVTTDQPTRATKYHQHETYLQATCPAAMVSRTGGCSRWSSTQGLRLCTAKDAL